MGLETPISSNALALREALGWSRERLARAANVPISSIYLLERLGFEETSSDRQILAALNFAVNQRLSAIAFQAELMAVSAYVQSD